MQTRLRGGRHARAAAECRAGLGRSLAQHAPAFPQSPPGGLSASAAQPHAHVVVLVLGLLLHRQLLQRGVYVRLAQYETGTRTPKTDLTAALADTLDVSPQALAVPDIDSYIGLMHTLFTLEDRYGLHIDEADGEVCLKVDVRKNKDAAQLHEMLCAWRQAAAMLKAGEITQEEYDRWRYRYPEFDSTQRWVKVPSQELSDMLVDAFSNDQNENENA